MRCNMSKSLLVVFAVIVMMLHYNTPLIPLKLVPPGPRLKKLRNLNGKTKIENRRKNEIKNIKNTKRKR